MEHWKLAAQKGPWAYRSLVGFHGKTCDDYPSAKPLKAEVVAARGQAKIVMEVEVLPKYGDQLFIASLGAVEESVAEDGDAEIRNGTNNVSIHNRIRV